MSVYIGNGTAGTYPDCDRRQRHSEKEKRQTGNCSKISWEFQNQGFADKKKMAAFLMQIIKGISTPENILGKSYIIVLNNDIEFTQKRLYQQTEKKLCK